VVNSAPVALSAQAAIPSAPAAAAPASESPPQNAVVSPMVGTAYLAPEPGAAPFVAVGARVAKGDTLLIIEAMKVMNPLPAPRAGTVSQVFVSDGMPVEFGQALLVID
jgi:acetyl-CoA carboxylase biotin carboxyl carrier protein